MKTFVRQVTDKEKGIKIKGRFTKEVVTDQYKILFNKYNGLEVLTGINGHSDPFWLNMPSMLDIGIMGHCENNCPFCYQGSESQPNMKLDDFKRIIDETKQFVMQVALGGRGDPNKHENFKEIIEYCCQNNVVPNYTTSGNGLTDEEVEISKNCGAVAVSSYDEYYTYDAIQKFITQGIKTNIHFVLTNSRMSSASFVAYGHNIWKGNVDFDKINAIIFLLFKPVGRGQGFGKMVPTLTQLDTFFDIVFGAKFRHSQNPKIGMDSCLVNYAKRMNKFDELQGLAIDTCEGARSSAYISPDMNMMPCSFASKHRSVSLKNKSIGWAWVNSPIFNTFRTMLKNNCDRCPLDEEMKHASL